MMNITNVGGLNVSVITNAKLILKLEWLPDEVRGVQENHQIVFEKIKHPLQKLNDYHKVNIYLNRYNDIYEGEQ